MTDSAGNFLDVIAPSGSIQDRDGAVSTIEPIKNLHPTIVKRSTTQQGFVIWPKDGLLNEILHGSINAEDWQRIGKTLYHHQPLGS